MSTVTCACAAALSNVTVIFGRNEAAVVALDGISREFRAGSFTAIMGPSGSGKTTLLQTIAGLISPTRGQVHLGERRIDDLPERELAVLRRDQVGFVFQDFNLLPPLTAAENITLPLRLARRAPEQEWFAQLTRRAGIEDRLDHRPDQLSGGQQQRVALCRALLTRPGLLCGDEPTGNLDRESGRQVMALLREAVDDFGQTLVLVTHDPIVAAYADEVIFLLDGSITHTATSPTAESVARTMTTLVRQR
ncbi:putative ABC transport system ATP-binding protein [Kineosphaera limosa]|nr:ABC transporter ATP-binding protein [Kineosphaera limosa]NYD99113.1 putative ABC transport system ATP-binding protein [Kineosphaera limosa]